MIGWPMALVIIVVVIVVMTSMAVIAVYQPEEVTPQVVCIKEHGQWNSSGFGRQGWNGTCVFQGK
jgi:hypothetical protein